MASAGSMRSAMRMATTLADYVETALDGSSNASAADPIHEVANIEAAMAYVDEVVQVLRVIDALGGTLQLTGLPGAEEQPGA